MPTGQLLRSFGGDQRGNIAIAFALSCTLIFTAMGAGLDLSRAYLARQKISEVATLACQYASHSFSADAAAQNDSATGLVTSFINTNWQTQNINLTQTNATTFNYVQGGTSTVSLAASVPTTFMELAGFTQIPISVQISCPSPVAAPSTSCSGAGCYLVDESFEAVIGAAVNHYTYYLPNGQQGSQSSPTGYNSAIGYTGSGGTQWHIMGYCIEQDIAGQIKSTAYNGNYTVELDCDNGNHSAGNSSISTLVTLAAGSYELRYSYTSRVDYPSYDPAYLCGSAASDLNWANSTSTTWSGTMATAYRTNQINVYLDLNVNNAPPVHTTLVGNEQLAGSNLIDMCVYGQNWIQRSVAINVTTAGSYWLSFAADGSNDSYGGQLDLIQLCSVYCPGTVQDNFTTAWAASSLLFEDDFESPSYSNGGSYNTNGNVNNSNGSSSFWTTSGNGWSNAPINQLPYWMSGCPQGQQCVELGWYGGASTANSLISQPFLLVPGYYQIQYDYVSEVTFSGLTSVYCGSTPSAANIAALSAGSGTGMDRVLTSVNHGTLQYDTNTVGVFMSHAQEASTPNSGNALGSTTSYTNPDGTTTTTPAVPPNYINLTSYNASQVNPLIDICGYASTAQTRTATVFIEKPAFYWLTLAALGTADQFGGQIDDIRIKAIGSPYTSSPPASVVTIPVPSPLPSSSIYFTGFSITADPLKP